MASLFDSQAQASGRLAWLAAFAMAIGALVASEARAQGLLVLNPNSFSGAVLRFDERTGALLGEFVTDRMFDSPHGSFTPTFGITFGPDGDLYLSNQGNRLGCEVWRYDGGNGAFKSTACMCKWANKPSAIQTR